MNVSDQLRDLTDDYLSGLLDEAGLRELEGLLRADAGARRYFVRYCALHTDLHLEARARHAGEQALRQIGGPAAGPPPRPARRWLASLPVKAALTAAVVLVAAGVIGWLVGVLGTGPTRASPPEEVAWLVNAQNCRWADDTEPAGSMRAGAVLRVEQGLAEVRFHSGARVVLEGPARLELLSGNSARLHSGRLTARVPEAARGFELLSPQGKLIDLGTEFGVSVGADGATDVFVFEGQVDASAAGRSVSVLRNQAARLGDGAVTLLEAPPRDQARGYTRAIVPPPVVVPRTKAFDFRNPVAGTLLDRDGNGTGLTQRLPGTGARLPERDPNLRLDAEQGRLELTTTNSDINTQYRLDHGEYLGVRLADLGFSGGEDFAVSVTLPSVPALKQVGQFGLYAGARSDRNIRGGLISLPEPGRYTLFLVNNNGGKDADAHYLDLHSAGDDLRITLRRLAGKYSLTVENRTTGSSSTLAIRHPDFLDDERDLSVGLFGANTQSNVRKTLVIQELQATVWTVTPPPAR